MTTSALNRSLSFDGARFRDKPLTCVASGWPAICTGAQNGVARSRCGVHGPRVHPMCIGESTTRDRNPGAADHLPGSGSRFSRTHPNPCQCDCQNRPAVTAASRPLRPRGPSCALYQIPGHPRSRRHWRRVGLSEKRPPGSHPGTRRCDGVVSPVDHQLPQKESP